MVHFVINLVLKLFPHSKFRETMKDENLPLSYVYRQLTNQDMTMQITTASWNRRMCERGSEIH